MDEQCEEGALCVWPLGWWGFWRRQFAGAPTPAQRRFDVLFGIVMPVLCFYFDPLVFRNVFESDGGLYAQHQFYAYALSALEMVALCAWLVPAGRAERRTAALAGMLLAGAVFASAVGVSILPYSALGLLFFLVGALGFVPFLTAVVYLRNGWRAAGAIGRAGAGSPKRAALALVCGFVFALVAPAVAQVAVNSDVPWGDIGQRLQALLD